MSRALWPLFPPDSVYISETITDSIEIIPTAKVIGGVKDQGELAKSVVPVK